MQFGTNGVRGLFNELGPKEALEIAQKSGMWLGKNIAVGRDLRANSETLMHAVISGLLSVGCNVFDMGVAPTPAIEWAVKKFKLDGAITITASHNPPEWNGIKVTDKRGAPIKKEIGNKMLSLKTQIIKNAGSVRKLSINEYIDKVKPSVSSDIIADCGNGVASIIAPRIFPFARFINNTPDSKFRGRPPEPKEENLTVLKEVVVESGAQGGVAWDGDCDRVVFIDEKGRFISGDYVLALCAKWLNAKKIATTVATSNVVKAVGEVIYTKIGVPYVAEKVVQKEAEVGGEENGGLIYGKFSNTKDGFLPVKLLCEALKEKPLSEWVKELPSYTLIKEKVYYENADEAIKKAKEYALKKGAEIIEIDGVRGEKDDYWFIVRKSGTEKGMVRIFAEAKTEEKAKAVVNEIKAYLIGK